MPKAPEWFLKELADFDSQLRVRWSVRTETFHLERRVTRSLHPGTIRCNDYHDDTIRARDGYILVGCIRPGLFSRSIFEKLRANDLWANGGWEKYAETIEAFEQAEEEKKWADYEDELKAQSAELYEHLKLRDGRSVYNAGWIQ
jgi:hypothetical protein